MDQGEQLREPLLHRLRPLCVFVTAKVALSLVLVEVFIDLIKTLCFTKYSLVISKLESKPLV